MLDQFPHLAQPVSVDQAFSAAAELHKEGRLGEAEDIYNKILSLQPAHDHALHLLGVVLSQRKDYSKAIELIGKAIDLCPNAPIFHLNLGNALFADGRHQEAAQVYQRALDMAPEFLEALFGLGNVCKGQNRMEEAAGFYKSALKINASHPESHNNLGIVLRRLGKTEEAMKAFEQACKLRPNDREPVFNMASTLKERGDVGEAALVLWRFLEMHPDDLETWRALGGLFQDDGDLEEAQSSYRRALEINPDHTGVLNVLGTVLRHQGRLNQSKLEEAVTCFKRALEINPGEANGHYNLANVLHDLGKFDEAIDAYRRAISFEGNFPEAHNNLGTTLFDRRQPEEAVAAYEKALELSPKDPDILTNRGMAFLLMGDFEKGWDGYENRFQAWDKKGKQRDFHQPRWGGEDLDGRTILIHGEQGFGDTLQFIRYASLVAERGGRVILECHPALEKLLTGVKELDTVVPKGDELPDFDVHCPLLSLPYSLKTRLETIPAEIPYISVDDDLAKSWKARLANGTELKVGIVWSGRTGEHDRDANIAYRRRSIPLQAIAPLANIEGIRLYSLQKGRAAQALNDTACTSEIVDHTDELHDFSDTAALLASLDLVISVDTSVAHLAGALAIHIWLLPCYDSCWRWLLERDDSPWYPTMRLFRQNKPAEWQDVIDQVGDALKDVVSGKQQLARR